MTTIAEVHDTNDTAEERQYLDWVLGSGMHSPGDVAVPLQKKLFDTGKYDLSPELAVESMAILHEAALLLPLLTGLPERVRAFDANVSALLDERGIEDVPQVAEPRAAIFCRPEVDLPLQALELLRLCVNQQLSNEGVAGEASEFPSQLLTEVCRGYPQDAPDNPRRI